MDKLKFKRTGNRPLKVSGEVIASYGEAYEVRSQEARVIKTARGKYAVAVRDSNYLENGESRYYADIFNTLADAIYFLSGWVDGIILDELMIQLGYFPRY